MSERATTMAVTKDWTTQSVSAAAPSNTEASPLAPCASPRKLKAMSCIVLRKRMLMQDAGRISDGMISSGSGCGKRTGDRRRLRDWLLDTGHSVKTLNRGGRHAMHCRMPWTHSIWRNLCTCSSKQCCCHSRHLSSYHHSHHSDIVTMVS